MKSSPPIALAGSVAGLEPDGVVFHLGHPGGVLGLGLGEEEGLEAADVGIAPPAGERVHVQAHEEVAGLGTVAAAVAQRDERIGRARHPDADAPALELVAEQQADLEGDFLLVHAAGEEGARVARIDAAVARDRP